MKTLKKNSLLTGTFVASALISTANTDATNLLHFDYLGTGGELRTQLLSNSTSNLLTNASEALKTIEGACGEKKTTEAKCGEAKCGEKKTETKTKEAKCGEAKCGEKKAETKTKEAKCGEAKCGEKKAEIKTKEAKCGEAKCGEK